MLRPARFLIPRLALLACLALTTLGPAAHADTIVLSNGEAFTGAIVSESPESVSIQVHGAVWTFTRNKVGEVRRDQAVHDRELAQTRARAFERAAQRQRTDERTAQGAGRQDKAAVRTASSGRQVVVYGTSWCGFCRKARAYFQQRGVAFADKDIERDPEAAAEMHRKMAKAGMPPNSGVPVIDVFGTLVLGFDEPAISTLLAQGR